MGGMNVCLCLPKTHNQKNVKSAFNLTFFLTCQISDAIASIKILYYALRVLSAGRTKFFGAEGATASETLRLQDR